MRKMGNISSIWTIFSFKYTIFIGTSDNFYLLCTCREIEIEVFNPLNK